MENRIYITGSGIIEEAEHVLTAEKCIFKTGNPSHSAEDIAAELEKFNPDGIIVRQGNINKEVQHAAKNLKVISKHGVGVDNIDLTAATERNIPVLITPRANFESTAEHTLALVLSLARRITEQNSQIRNGVFDKKNYAGLELYGKMIGIIGFGKIGRRLSELLAPFGVKILVYHPSQRVETLAPHITKVSDVNKIFIQADIISLNCPLNKHTHHLINSVNISKMKKNVLIINSSRGKIINELHLEQALLRGRIQGAALDVFEYEPPDTKRPLFNMDNVILTPHIAGISDNSFRNMSMNAVDNLLRALRGNPFDMDSLVNKEILNSYRE